MLREDQLAMPRHRQRKPKAVDDDCSTTHPPSRMPGLLSEVQSGVLYLLGLISRLRRGGRGSLFRPWWLRCHADAFVCVCRVFIFKEPVFGSRRLPVTKLVTVTFDL